MIRNIIGGDIVTSGQHFVTGKNETSLSVSTRLKMFYGEYFLDVYDGTPWFQEILGKTPQDIAEINVKHRILTAPGVVTITRFNLSLEAVQRNMIVDVDIIDVNSESLNIVLNEEII